MSDTADRATSKNLSSLRALWPFLRPYRGLMAAALLALVLTASISLVFPLAVRRVIDTFNVEQVGLLDQYFGAAIAIAALLALGTAVRYLLVTRLRGTRRHGHSQGCLWPCDRHGPQFL
jgi:ATP-binding cassette subfamily B protein